MGEDTMENCKVSNTPASETLLLSITFAIEPIQQMIRSSFCHTFHPRSESPRPEGPKAEGQHRVGDARRVGLQG